MYNDLLGNKIDTDSDEEEIKLTFKRSLVDDLYALHGMVAIKSFLQMADALLKKIVISQIRNNRKKDKNYYEEITKKVFDKLMEEKKNAARNTSK